MYQVCASAIGGCDADPYCDTITVALFDDMTMELMPQNPVLCYDDVGLELTASVEGGVLRSPFCGIQVKQTLR